MHRLKSFEGVVGLRVVRDAEFALTGKLSTQLNGLLVPLRSTRYLAEVNGNSRVAAVIASAAAADGVDPRLGLAIADDPEAAHAEVHALCAQAHHAKLRDQTTRIDSTARIHGSASISEYGVQIGPRANIGPNVVVLPGVILEQDCTLHPGVVLGVEGFQVGRMGGRQRIIPQVGGVRLRSGVELLANSCVARALFGGETTIGDETVTDNLVYIAHDCQIGRRVQICALANILGRVVIGDDAYVGPSAVIKNGLVIGEGAKVSMGGVVTQNVGPGQTVSGNFAIDHERFVAHIRSIRS